MRLEEWGRWPSTSVKLIVFCRQLIHRNTELFIDFSLCFRVFCGKIYGEQNQEITPNYSRFLKLFTLTSHYDITSKLY
jgi:hypothetical protein